MKYYEVLKTQKDISTITSDPHTVHRIIMKLLGNNDKVKVEVPGVNQLTEIYTEPINLNPVEFKKDQEYYFPDSTNSKGILDFNWIKGKVIDTSNDHLALEIEGPDPVRVLHKDCLCIQIGNLQPIEYHVDTERFPEEFYEFFPVCPKTKIIYD